MSATIDFGIDLGTTNSSIALCRNADVRVFQTTDLMNVTQSVVHISKSGRMLVGKRAYDAWVSDPQNTQAEFKRWMGYNDRLKFPASGKELGAEELSAEVLKSLRSDAARQTGERVDAAVITVPAAFGTLQCDATARAAKLAGFERAPLLQEPIAAAIAYGASPASHDQRWMIFDLGGGTLDIAIVSTRDGRLAVLEHQGNNRLGGKDIDRALADALLLQRLRESFHLPEPQEDRAAFDRLTRALTRHAEQAKIALSTAEETTVDLFDLGDDLDGKPIEASFSLKRTDLETTIQPIVGQCLDLARRALEGARLSGSDLDRILLVGGPTQIPVIRSSLTDTLGAKLDCTLDPMTVVARGAALFASSLEKTTASTTPASEAKAAPAVGTVQIELAFERASGTLHSPVAGTFDSASGIHEIKIDAAGGIWTSGWLPAPDGCFQTDVRLSDRSAITKFAVLARDRSGNAIAIDPAEFSIAYMLPMAAPPLPHTIAIELSTSHGITTFDPVFKRHCPLPAEVRKTYKADRALRPSEIDTTLPIKLWEIEVSDDPQEKWWAGCVHIRADEIKRPIIEGTELELSIKIDSSRRVTVEVFVPMLNQSFSRQVYVPDAPSAHSHIQQQLDGCFARLKRIEEEIYGGGRDDLTEAFTDIQLAAEEIAEELATAEARGGADPDASLQAEQVLRNLRQRLSWFEEQLGISGVSSSTIATRLSWFMPYVERIVAGHGTDSDKRELAKLRDQYEKYLKARDNRGMQWIDGQLEGRLSGVIEGQMWYWQQKFHDLKSSERQYLNREQADKALADGDEAEKRADLPALRAAVRKLWGLQPRDSLQTAHEQTAQSGLRAQ